MTLSVSVDYTGLSASMSVSGRTASTHRASGRLAREIRHTKPTRVKHTARAQTFVAMVSFLEVSLGNNTGACAAA